MSASHFFSDATRVQALRSECESWRRTPFRFGSSAKGIDGGTDCVGFCEAVLVAAGVFASFNFPRTPADNSRHVHNDKILNYLRGKIDDPQSVYLSRCFEELPLTEFMSGDLLLLRTGKGLWHMCVMLSSTAFMQCAFPDGVTEGNITTSNYRKYLVAAFRARALSSSTAQPFNASTSSP
jgi:cell wall-associated NlpC family hydrolase